MHLTMLKCKLHQARVTQTALDGHEPTLVYCDGDNRITHSHNAVPLQPA